jgi:dolichol-phosphate mannosyltransferase
MNAAPAVSVVLPTYNEAESLPVIVPRIAETLQAANVAFEIIIVDDNSPDGTSEVATELGKRFPVRVNKRTTERGLATAVLAGFAMSEAPVCVVMDADGSHPVEALPEMVRIILADKADIVVGSRHVPGGGSRDWPVFSQLKSKLAATLAFGVTSMTDPTTGFMALRRSLLPGLQLDPVGWKIVLEIVVKAAPVRIAEVPIIFTDRTLGMSKQSLGVFTEYLAHLAKLYAHRYPSLAELVKFCLVGLFGLMVDMATVVGLKEAFGLDTRLCAVAGFTVAVTSNFVLNRKYTFRHAAELPWLFSFATYVGTNLFGLALRMLAIQLLIVMAGIDKGRGYVLTNLVGIVLATLLNFIGAKYFAFDPDRIKYPKPEADTGTAKPVSIPAASMARGVPVLLLVAAAYAFASSVPHPQLSLPDEGVNVTMAQNIRHSAQLLVRPSVFPAGRSDWLHEDLPALGNLPIYPALLALLPKALDLSGMVLLSWLALCVSVVCTARMVALVDRRAGMYTALLMATSPAVLSAFRHIEFEPVLTAFCAAGAYAFVHGLWNKRLSSCVLGGALLGLGFLTKMWLIIPYAFALLAFCVVEAAAVRQSGASAGLRKSVAVALLGFAVTACAHLLFVAAKSPADLPHWISSVYLGIFSGEGITGSKLSGIGVYAEHRRGAFYYPLVLYRDHFFLFPLCLFGIGELLRQSRPRVGRVLAMVVGALGALVVLSVPAYKEPRYVLAVVPWLYVLSGLAVSALGQAADKLRPANTAIVRAVIALCWLSTLLVAIASFAQWQGLAVSGRYAVAHALGMLLCVVAGELWLRKAKLVAVIGGLCALGLLAFALADARDKSAAPEAELAQLLQPHLTAAAPAYPSFVATDHAQLQGYLERTGIGWDELAAQPAQGWPNTPALTAIVVAPGEATNPRVQAWVAWLSTHATELETKPLAPGYRVFVP